MSDDLSNMYHLTATDLVKLEHMCQNMAKVMSEHRFSFQEDPAGQTECKSMLTLEFSAVSEEVYHVKVFRVNGDQKILMSEYDTPYPVVKEMLERAKTDRRIFREDVLPE